MNIETFDELVDYWSGRILKGLIAGEFRSTVYVALVGAIQWESNQEKNQTKKDKRKKRR